MKHTLLLTLLSSLLCGSFTLSAQTTESLYVPLELRNAYAKETRGHDGKPGKNYFQNRANYVIKADFNPATKMLTGTESVTYYNNSNDSLSQLCFNLFQNIYKKGNNRDSNIDAINIHDGVEILSVKVDGTPVPAEKFRFFSTIFLVPAGKKIAPKRSAIIEIEWREKMPVTIAKRQGTYQESNFFIAYWYPKLCVYDDIEGWNTAGYTGQAEFYSDFADYTVEITMPSDYTVWSSGQLVNGSDIFQEAVKNRLHKAALSDSVIHIISEADRQAKRITHAALKNTWKYQLTNQMDFAFAASNTYVWDATSVAVGSNRVLISSVYSRGSINCNKIPDVARKAIQYYSSVNPAVPFPEQEVTLFEGGPGGMEFPGMINQQDFRDPMESMMVTVHELGHAYLPFYAGINEQKNGWMDEGIFTLVGFLGFCDQAGDKDLNFFQMLVNKYSEDASVQATDVPMMQMSYKLGDFTYGFVTYTKPAAAFWLLYNYLGKETFTSALQHFLSNWKGLHPTPYDLFNSFNSSAGEDLGWFWKPWFFEFGYADLAIGKIEKTADGNKIEILNLGGYPVPVNLIVKYADGTEKSFSEKMSCWKSGTSSLKIKIPPGEIREIRLNPVHIPESDFSNNVR